MPMTATQYETLSKITNRQREILASMTSAEWITRTPELQTKLTPALLAMDPAEFWPRVESHFAALHDEFERLHRRWAMIWVERHDPIAGTFDLLKADTVSDALGMARKAQGQGASATVMAVLNPWTAPEKVVLAIYP